MTDLFAAEYLQAGAHSPYFDVSVEHLGGEERGRGLANIGLVLQHLLAKTALGWRTIEALVWMVAEYTHERLKVDPRLDITSHLLQAARTEPALHAMKAYYRDHFFHAIEVCFLGHLLLTTSDQSGRLLWQSVAGRLRGARCTGKWPRKEEADARDSVNTLEDVLRQWYVAALLHDVGSAIEVFRALQKMLDFYHHPREMKDFRARLQKSLDALSASILASNIAALLDVKEKDEPGSDHGVIAAAHLSGLLDQLQEDAYPGDYYPAIRAIGLHNNHRAVVSYETDPLAVLLILCDTIQEWNRPHLRHATAPSMLLARLLAADASQESTTGPLDTISLNVERSGKPHPRPRFLIKPPGTLGIDLTYTEEIQTDAGVFNLWIDSSCNFQRLRLDALPFNIEVSFRTPWFRLPGRDPQSQMARLRDAAADTHMHFLRDWFPSSTDGKNATGAVRYKQEKLGSGHGNDVVTLDLRRLGEKKTVTSDIHHFRDCLRTWKRCNEDRYLEGDYAPRIPGE